MMLVITETRQTEGESKTDRQREGAEREYSSLNICLSENELFRELTVQKAGRMGPGWVPGERERPTEGEGDFTFTTWS